MNTLIPHPEEVVWPFFQQPELETEEYWALWRDLTEQARVLTETAAVFRVQARESESAGIGILAWQEKLKEAIRRERKARHMIDRAAMFKRIYWMLKERNEPRR